jgi:hypothetical protein
MAAALHLRLQIQTHTPTTQHWQRCSKKISRVVNARTFRFRFRFVHYEILSINDTCICGTITVNFPGNVKAYKIIKPHVATTHVEM